ncbi:MAG: hypothetical protein SGJ19_07530 [Planctomycetia bacterium]|nr:hypothetical protein [Planctomycetia bacterium]
MTLAAQKENSLSIDREPIVGSRSIARLFSSAGKHPPSSHTVVLCVWHRGRFYNNRWPNFNGSSREFNPPTIHRYPVGGVSDADGANIEASTAGFAA